MMPASPMPLWLGGVEVGDGSSAAGMEAGCMGTTRLLGDPTIARSACVTDARGDPATEPLLGVRKSCEVVLNGPMRGEEGTDPRLAWLGMLATSWEVEFVS